MKLAKRYAFAISMLLFAGFLALVFPQSRAAIGQTMVGNIREMLSILPPIFILMGLADVHISRETVIRYMGHGSALVGVGLAVLLGALAAGPLYAAFPIASVMLRKGASFRNVMIFIGAWSTLKVPMFLFETDSLGAAFSITRWITSLVAVTIISTILSLTISDREKEEIMLRQEEMNR